MPLAERPAGAHVRIFRQLKRRVGLKRLQNQSTIVQGLVVGSLQSLERCNHLVASVKRLESHPVRIT